MLHHSCFLYTSSLLLYNTLRQHKSFSIMTGLSWHACTALDFSCLFIKSCILYYLCTGVLCYYCTSGSEVMLGQHQCMANFAMRSIAYLQVGWNAGSALIYGTLGNAVLCVPSCWRRCWVSIYLWQTLQCGALQCGALCTSRWIEMLGQH